MPLVANIQKALKPAATKQILSLVSHIYIYIV